ncbi:hypothetical protein V6N13_126745 [Hibiscus sabdariffa]|uniref:AMP-binding enzyme C-terminal domain-containing protein n=1 Tax=Hibiscus sabdariffa TaxID=183260 RepID=A0ABR2REK0_9ROSI
MMEVDMMDPESGVSVKRDGSTLREIILRGACVMSGNEYCRANLAHYMVPKMVVFKKELPKTSIGKIHMFVLREIARGMSSSHSTRAAHFPVGDCHRRGKGWCMSAQVAHFSIGDCHGRGKEKGRDLRSEWDGKIVNM